MKIDCAIRIAEHAHRGQIDKGGQLYILHPLWVMQHVPDGEDYQVVAVLHDVVEDNSEYTIDSLRRKGLTDIQAEALDLLTHKKGISYVDYIKGIKQNEIALKVKLACLTHNLQPRRISDVIMFIKNNKEYTALQAKAKGNLFMEKVRTYWDSYIYLSGTYPFGLPLIAKLNLRALYERDYEEFVEFCAKEGGR